MVLDFIEMADCKMFNLNFTICLLNEFCIIHFIPPIYNNEWETKK